MSSTRFRQCECNESGSNMEDIKQEWLLMWGARELRDEGSLVDVTLVVEGKKIKPCHRVVLASSSPYFRAMFTTDMAERNMGEVELKGVEFASVDMIVEYLYTSKITITDDNVQSLLTSCSMLQILGLHGRCRRYMLSRLTLHNCLDLYNFAKSLGNAELQKGTFDLVARRFCDVIKTKEFLELDKESLVDIISSDQLMVEREEMVYEASLKWLSHDISNRSSFICEVFSYVRMSLFSEDYLNQCIVNEEALMGLPQLNEQVKATILYKGKKKLLEKSNAETDDSSETARELNEEQVSSASPSEELTSRPQTEVEISSLISTNSQSGLTPAHIHFIDFPFYHITPKNCTRKVRIPLITRPRSGMMGTTVLLFTNGKRTAIFDPIKNRHISDITACSEQTDGDSGFNQKLPEMKNAEVFASRNGTVYLLGGLEIDKSSNNVSLMAKLYVLNLKSLQWTRKASLPSPRCMMGMGELNGEFFVTGGKELSTGNGLSTVFKYNFDDDSWISFTPLPTPVYGHGCASLKDRIYVLGGKTNEKKLSTDVYFLPTDTRQWCHAPSLLIPRFLAGNTVITSPHSPHTTHGATDTIYIVGGVGNEGLLTSIESYSPACDTGWNLFGEFPGGRCAQTVTSVNGNLCVVGGHVTERDDSGRYVSRAKFDVMLHDVTTQNEENPGNSWRKIVSHIRGIENGLFACADLKLDPAQIGR